MKKFLSVFLAALLCLSIAACAGDEKESSSTSALDILTTVWDSYEENEKFPAAGGDMSEENMTMDGPGAFSLTDAAALDTALGFPQGAVDKIDQAASLVHMMNANTFTCGVFHVKDEGETAEVFAAIQENISQRQWMCGFPDKLVVVRVGGCLVSCFGKSEMVDAFQAKLKAAYPSGETLCDEPIM